MKAGGVDVVSAYTIWIHHEEEEGIFDFSGQRDLRAFLALVQKCGLKCFLRIGPWVHGEVRNGGFPDWEGNFDSLKLQCKVCFGNLTMICVPEAPMLNVPEAAIVADPLLARFEKAGVEYAAGMTLSSETIASLETPMIPNEQYIAIVNGEA